MGFVVLPHLNVAPEPGSSRGWGWGGDAVKKKSRRGRVQTKRCHTQTDPPPGAKISKFFISCVFHHGRRELQPAQRFAPLIAPDYVREMLFAQLRFVYLPTGRERGLNQPG